MSRSFQVGNRSSTRRARPTQARGKLFAKLDPPDRGRGPRRRRRPRRQRRRCARWCQKARDASMPIDTIERAIKRGTGELEGVTYESITYEGYAPDGVAVLVEALTDNRNRTGAEIKNVFTPQRRLARRAGRGGVAVRAQGRRDPADTRRPTRTTSCSPRSTPAPRTSPTRATRGRSPPPPTELHAVRDRARGGRHHGRQSADLTMLPTTTRRRSTTADAAQVGAAGDRRARGARRRAERLRQLRHPRLRAGSHRALTPAETRPEIPFRR